MSKKNSNDHLFRNIIYQHSHLSLQISIQNIEYEIITETFKFKILSLKSLLISLYHLKFINNFVSLKHVLIFFIIFFNYATCNVDNNKLKCINKFLSIY